MGSAAVYDRFARGEQISTIRSSWIEETRKFGEMREKYFLYR